MKSGAAKINAHSQQPEDQAMADSCEESKIGDVVRNARVSLDLKSEKLNYILEMLSELRKLSATIDEPMVAYLIEMAILETNTAVSVINFGIEAGERDRRGF